jgi:hypothetical protein
MGTAPKELATIVHSVEGAVVMGNKPVVEVSVVETVVKVPMMVVKDEE